MNGYRDRIPSSSHSSLHSMFVHLTVPNKVRSVRLNSVRLGSLATLVNPAHGSIRKIIMALLLSFPTILRRLFDRDGTSWGVFIKGTLARRRGANFRVDAATGDQYT